MTHGYPVVVRASSAHEIEPGVFRLLLPIEPVDCEALSREIEFLDVEETCKISLHRAVSRALIVDALHKCVIEN